MLSAPIDCSALPFSILAVLAVDEKGEFIDTKIKSLVRLCRPDRLGNLAKLDFVKSIDTGELRNNIFFIRCNCQVHHEALDLT